MKIIKDKQDLTYLVWSKVRNSSGTAGSFLKSYEEINKKKIYYKLSNFTPVDGIIGHESVNEVIVDRLLTILGVPHVDYTLVNADILVNGKRYTTYLCYSEDFKQKGEQKITLEAFYENERQENETPLEFCIRKGWEKEIYEMIAVDYLILNRDRHGANIEVLKDKQGNYRLTPLFDHGISLLFSCYDEKQLNSFDVLEDRPVQSFVGGHSAFDNLSLIVPPKFNRLVPEDKEKIFRDMNGIISQPLIDKIWEMIYKRWYAYENFCNKK